MKSFLSDKKPRNLLPGNSPRAQQARQYFKCKANLGNTGKCHLKVKTKKYI